MIGKPTRSPWTVGACKPSSDFPNFWTPSLILSSPLRVTPTHCSYMFFVWSSQPQFSGLVLDLVQDIRGVNDQAMKARKTGVLVLGGFGSSGFARREMRSSGPGGRGEKPSQVSGGKSRCLFAQRENGRCFHSNVSVDVLILPRSVRSWLGLFHHGLRGGSQSRVNGTWL